MKSCFMKRIGGGPKGPVGPEEKQGRRREEEEERGRREEEEEKRLTVSQNLEPTGAYAGNEELKHREKL